jgi:hypothetical protein
LVLDSQAGPIKFQSPALLLSTAKMAKLAVIYCLVVAVSCLELTPDNWAGAVAGKSVFIKFYAPWDNGPGSSMAIKPAWDKLMSDFQGSATALVAEVDCTSGGGPLCKSNSVQGFPTLKWGDPDSLQGYDGDHDYDTLKKFCDGNLKPIVKKADIEAAQALYDNASTQTKLAVFCFIGILIAGVGFFIKVTFNTSR